MSTPEPDPAVLRFVDEHLEASVIGACLIEPRRVAETSSLVEPGDFYRTTNERAWRVLVDLDAGVDQILLAAELARRHPHDLPPETARPIAFAYVDACPLACNAARYARAVHELACRRRLDAACQAWLDDPIDESARAVRDALAGLRQHLQAARTVAA